MRADFDDPACLTQAMATDGEELRVLFISGSEVGKRQPQHQAVIDAAASAGVAQLVYTSAPRATTTQLVLAPDHKYTEEAIAASGVPATILRDNWYVENYTSSLKQAEQTGELIGSGGQGRIAPATRADFAAAAAAVLTTDGYVGQTYELAGDERLTYGDIAAAMSEVSGQTIVYKDLASAEHVAALTAAGLDEGTAEFVAALDEGIRRGDLDVDDHTLSRLVGRPTTPFADGLRSALA